MKLSSVTSYVVPPWVKPALIALVLFLAYLGVRVWLHDRDERIAAEQTAKQAVRTSQAAVAISDDGSQVQAEVQRIEFTIREDRAASNRQQETLRNENSNVGGWSNGRIPVELRDADRKARLARQRRSRAADASEDAAKTEKD